MKEVGLNTKGPFVRVEDEEPQNFDVVILAVGFGRDAHDGITEGYWTDTRLDGLEVESGRTWFVSGYGDGALTDLMRLCIMDFRHGKVLAAVDEATRQEVGSQLLQAERSSKLPEELVSIYRSAAAKIADKLDTKLKARQSGKIWLNCSETDLFSPKSSILNRFIAAYLLNGDRFELSKKHKLLEPKKAGDGYIIQFADANTRIIADNVLIRHGPDKAFHKGFSEFSRAFRNLETDWKSVRQHEDWTRKPLYQNEEFNLEEKKSRVLGWISETRLAVLLLWEATNSLVLAKRKTLNRHFIFSQRELGVEPSLGSASITNLKRSQQTTRCLHLHLTTGLCVPYVIVTSLCSTLPRSKALLCYSSEFEQQFAAASQ